MFRGGPSVSSSTCSSPCGDRLLTLYLLHGFQSQLSHLMHIKISGSPHLTLKCSQDFGTSPSPAFCKIHNPGFSGQRAVEKMKRLKKKKKALSFRQEHRTFCLYWEYCFCSRGSHWWSPCSCQKLCRALSGCSSLNPHHRTVGSVQRFWFYRKWNKTKTLKWKEGKQACSK